MRKKRKGSLTVEAALICPIFIIVMLALIYIITWFQTAAKVQTNLVSRARELAIVSVSWDRNEDIELTEHYKMKHLPVSVCQKIVTRPYVGVDMVNGTLDDIIVYITSKGSVYHTNRCCTYIKVNSICIRGLELEFRRNRSGGIYHPCEVCIKHEAGLNEQIYITEYGDRYHNSVTCNSIARDVIAIHMSEARGMRQCQKCLAGW